ncbi:MAG: hypothetical protein ACUVTM_01585 [Candidatus Bathyarchaeia archaeon]
MPSQKSNPESRPAMRVDRRGLTILPLIIMMLTSAFIMFTPNLERLNIINELMDTWERSSGSDTPAELVEPKLSTVKLRVTITDMGYSKNPINGTVSSPKPVPNAVVFLSWRFAITDWKGEVTIRAPHGNCTLAVSRDRVGWWRTEIIIEKEEEKFEVSFILHRLAPLNITVEAKPSAEPNHVTLLFQIPDGGPYYIGMAVITYYTTSGLAEVYREDFSEAIPLRSIRNLWGYSPSAGHSYRGMILIDYDHKASGGEILTVRIDVRGNPAYVISWMSYLPIESVTLERID